MKELSIEEKAKAYDEALNIAREILDHTSENYLCTHLTKEDIKDMYIRFFPELAGSEDEKVKKALIEMVHDTPNIECEQNYNVRKEDCLTWLEKQGETYTKKDVADLNEFVKEYSFNIPSDIYNFLPREKQSAWINEIENAIKAGAQWAEKQGESYTKRDVDDAWLKGMCDAKRELEKQGEQKPITEMKSAEESLGISSETYNEIVNDYIFGENKPKFKVDEWIVYYRNDSSREIMQIYDIRDGRYYFTDNIHFSWSVKECDEKSHLWTIQDAKDGDVLKEDSCIFIIKKINPNGTAIVHCCLFDDGELDLTSSTLGFAVDSTYPAIKEQRDLLFLKMHEAGYEWDADKKELKKISQRMISAEAKEAMYAKTAWSEDDEKMLVDAYVMLDWYKGNNWWTARRIKDWLETLKQRIGG